MKITNNHDLPKHIYDDIVAKENSNPYINNSFNKDTDFRVTELMDAPLPITLAKKYKDSDEYIVDASYFLPMYIGTGIHKHFEGHSFRATKPNGNAAVFEHHVSKDFVFDDKEFAIHGTADEIQFSGKDNVILIDNKTAFTGSVYKPVDNRYILQVNMYLYLGKFRDMNCRGFIRYIYKDWAAIRSFAAGYPICMINEREVDIMPVQEVRDYIENQVRDHKESPERPCTQTERNLGRKTFKIFLSSKPNKAKIATYADENGIRKEIDTYEKAAELMQGLPEKARGEAYIKESTDDLRCKMYCKVQSICPYAKEKGYQFSPYVY